MLSLSLSTSSWISKVHHFSAASDRNPKVSEMNHPVLLSVTACPIRFKAYCLVGNQIFSFTVLCQGSIMHKGSSYEPGNPQFNFSLISTIRG